MARWDEDRQSWFEAEIGDEDGSLARPLPPGYWHVPEKVAVDGDRLVWVWTETKDEPGVVQAEASLINGFVDLANAAPDQILRYARRWGPLGLFDDTLMLERPLLGSVHVRAIQPHIWHHPRSLFAEGEPFGWEGWEPLELWRHFARQARSLINISAQLHNGEIGRVEDWQKVFEWHEGKIPWWPRRLDWERSLVQAEANHWFTLANVRPELSWESEGAPEMRFGGGLLGALAVQLMGAISRTPGVAVCSACGTPYLRERRPQRGRRNYCPNCGRRAAWRNAKWKQRQKGSE